MYCKWRSECFSHIKQINFAQTLQEMRNTVIFNSNPHLNQRNYLGIFDSLLGLISKISESNKPQDEGGDQNQKTFSQAEIKTCQIAKDTVLTKIKSQIKQNIKNLENFRLDSDMGMPLLGFDMEKKNPYSLDEI